MMTSNNLSKLLLFLMCFLTGGCTCTYTQAPGAVGKVVDADTGTPVRGANITRLSVAPYFPRLTEGSQSQAWQPPAPPQGLPAVTVPANKNGSFNLPPDLYTTLIPAMHSPNPAKTSGSFVVIANGYVTNDLHGFATAHDRWRVHFGRVPLKKLNESSNLLNHTD